MAYIYLDSASRLPSLSGYIYLENLARMDEVGVPCGKSWIRKGYRCSKGKAAYVKENRQADLVKAAARVKESQRQKSYAKRGMTRPEIAAEESRLKKKGSLPHSNPKTHQEFIENGKVVLGDFAEKAKAVAVDVDFYSQDKLRHIQDFKNENVLEYTEKAKSTKEIAPYREKFEKAKAEYDSLYEDYWDFAKSKNTNHAERSLLRAKMNEVGKIKENARKKYEKELNIKMNQMLNEAAKDTPEVKKLEKKIFEATKSADELMDRLISGSTVSRQDAAKIYDRLKIPPSLKKADPKLKGRVEVIMQLTNGKGSKSLKEIKPTNSRAKATRDGAITVYPGNAAVLAHEMAHHIEFENPAVGEAAKSWVESRASSSKMLRLRSITANNRYSRDEMAYPDQFIHPYVGKIYDKGKDGVQTTEVMSVGVEQFSSAEKLIQFGAKDPEHLAFVLGVLRSNV